MSSDLVDRPRDEVPSGDDLLSVTRPQSRLDSLPSTSSYLDSGVAENSYRSQADAASCTEAVETVIHLSPNSFEMQRLPSLLNRPKTPLTERRCENGASDSPAQANVARLDARQGSDAAEGDLEGEPPVATKHQEEVLAQKLDLSRYIHDKESVGDSVEKYTCPVCQCLLRKAVQTKPCGHLYCFLCYQQARR